jgi:7-cyano-7-deazaguanine synthase
MKALVLSSGGIDSTTCIGLAVEKYGQTNVETVSIFYGQRHDKELNAAKSVSEFYGIKHYEIDLSHIFSKSTCPLLATSEENIPLKSYAEQIEENGTGKVSTYVPFRNGLFLSCAATLAMSIFPESQVAIYIGAHADDAAGDAYADCSPEFTDAIAQAISIGTYRQCTLVAPLVNMTKAQVVKEGLRLGVPYQLTWSCYLGKDKPCGQCATCIDREKAFALNNTIDPARI